MNQQLKGTVDKAQILKSDIFAKIRFLLDFKAFLFDKYEELR